MIDFLRYSHITVVCWKIRGGEIGEDFRCTMWFFVNDVHQIPLVNKVRPTPALTISYYLIILHTKKRGASFVARFTFWRPSHCPVHRNEQRGLAPRVYIDNNTRWQLAAIATVYHQRGLYFIHLKWGVPVALFLTNRWICEVLRMSKPKRPENAFFYMSIPHSPTSGTNLRLCHKVKKNIQYIKTMIR